MIACLFWMATDFSVVSNSTTHLSVGSHFSHLSDMIYKFWVKNVLKTGAKCIGQLCFRYSKFPKISTELLDENSMQELD